MFAQEALTLMESAADRLLQEERDIKPRNTPTGRSLQSHFDPSGRRAGIETLKAALSGGTVVCLLWCLNVCTKSENHCGKLHMCPFCGSSTKG